MKILTCICCPHVGEPDGEARFISVNSGGHLRVSPKLGSMSIHQRHQALAERMGAYVCGQRCALRVTERFLDRGTFDPAAVTALEQQLLTTLSPGEQP